MLKGLKIKVRNVNQLFTGAKLLDLGQVGLESVVYPSEDVVTTQIVSSYARAVNVDGHFN